MNVEAFENLLWAIRDYIRYFIARLKRNER